MEGSEKFRGAVKKVGLAYSQIMKDDGELLLVPNAEMLKAPTVNRSRRKFRVVRSSFPVASFKGGSLDDLCKEMQQAVAAHPDVLTAEQAAAMKKKSPNMRVFPAQCTFSGYGHQGAKLDLVAYLARDMNHNEFIHMQSEILLSANRVLEAHSAEIGLEAHHMLRLEETRDDGEVPQEAPAKANGNKVMANQLRSMIGRIDEALMQQRSAQATPPNGASGGKRLHKGMTEDLRAMVSRIDDVLK